MSEGKSNTVFSWRNTKTGTEVADEATVAASSSSLSLVFVFVSDGYWNGYVISIVNGNFGQLVVVLLM